MLLRRKHSQNYIRFYFDVMPKMPTQHKERKLLVRKQEIYTREEKL